MAIHIYLENAPRSGLFNYRGEAGINDDPQGFKRIQEGAGHRVFFRAEKFGTEDAGIPGAVSGATTHPATEGQLSGRDIPLSMFEAVPPVLAAVEEN